MHFATKIKLIFFIYLYKYWTAGINNTWLFYIFSLKFQPQSVIKKDTERLMNGPPLIYSKVYSLHTSECYVWLKYISDSW